MEILELSQIFARRKVRSPTFVQLRISIQRQRLWVGLAVYSSGNIAFNRGTLRRDSARSLPVILRVSPFAIWPRERKIPRRIPASFRARISRASFRELQQLRGKLQSAAEREQMLNFHEKLHQAVTRRRSEYAPFLPLSLSLSLHSKRKLQVSTVLRSESKGAPLI